MRNGVANVASRRVLLVIPHHTFSNHNGGNLVIGPDGMLYIGTGDGGGGGDTLHNGQNLDSLLGKILRIDPRKNGSKPYSIPPGNPFAGQPGRRGAIWMYGLRNPWRFSFDRKTHDMWIGDVGQDQWEEIDFASAGRGGINWGWNLREGKHAYNGGARPPGAHDPIWERSHGAGDCAIIGGYVYRGSAITSLAGAYLYGDECTGEIRALVRSGGRLTQHADLHLNVSSAVELRSGSARRTVRGVAGRFDLPDRAGSPAQILRPGRWTSVVRRDRGPNKRGPAHEGRSRIGLSTRTRPSRRRTAACAAPPRRTRPTSP